MIHEDIIKGYHPYVLVKKLNDENIADPDSAESPGGVFLTGIAQRYAEYRGRFFATSDEDELFEAVNEVADECIPADTHNRWQIITDLTLYAADFEAGGRFEWSEITNAITDALNETARNLLTALIKEDEAAVFQGAMGEDTGEDDA
jgi:hypothetical protein